MTYVVLAGVYASALLAHSVWGPLQLIGATAGALIAFIFPALLILRAEHSPQVRGPCCLAECSVVISPERAKASRFWAHKLRAMRIACIWRGASIWVSPEKKQPL